MLQEIKGNKFESDLVRQIKRGKDIKKLIAITDLIVHEKWGIAERKKHRDHPLKGNWQGYRDCHIEGDWLLIYKVEAGTAFFARTGTHADLFE